MVRALEDFTDDVFAVEVADHLLDRPSKEVSIRLEDLDPSLTNEELDIQTMIVGSVFEWQFRLKNKPGTKLKPKEVLCKLKLAKNLTSGSSLPSGQTKQEKVTWRFVLTPDHQETRSVYLLDIAATVAFDCRVAVRD